MKDLFRKCGTVLRADVALSPDNRSKGFGTVLFANRDDALRAIDTYNQFVWQGRVLDVRLDQQDPHGTLAISMPQMPLQNNVNLPHPSLNMHIPGGGWNAVSPMEMGGPPLGNGMNSNASTGPGTILSTSPSNGDPRSRPSSSAGLEDGPRLNRDDSFSGQRSNPLASITNSQNPPSNAQSVKSGPNSHGPHMYGGQSVGLVPTPFLGNGPNGPMFAVPAYYPHMPGGLMGYYNQGSVSLTMISYPNLTYIFIASPHVFTACSRQSASIRRKCRQITHSIKNVYGSPIVLATIQLSMARFKRFVPSGRKHSQG